MKFNFKRYLAIFLVMCMAICCNLFASAESSAHANDSYMLLKSIGIMPESCVDLTSGKWTFGIC